MKTETCKPPVDAFTTGRILTQSLEKSDPSKISRASSEPTCAASGSTSTSALANVVFAEIVNALTAGIESYKAITFKLPPMTKGIIKSGEKITIVNKPQKMSAA